MDKFFGSKLNTVLLLILIILMFFAIKVMLQNKEEYLTPLDNKTDTPVARQVSGNKDDLVYFSIAPESKVSGVVSYKGSVKGAYFFEANIRINVLDANKNVLKKGNATATTDWMTVEPVSFEGSIDFTGLPKGPGFIQIQNDNPSDNREFDKFIFIPVIIE